MQAERAAQKPVVRADVPARHSDPRVESLSKILHGLFDLGNKIGGVISALTRADAPNLMSVSKDVETFHLCWGQFCDEARRVHPQLVGQLQQLQTKNTTVYMEPIPAKSLLQIIILHLTSEQPIHRRLEHILEMERQKKEFTQYLESGLKTLYENFQEVATRLNLLLFMKNSLEKDGVLPANVMYAHRIPQIMQSPFGVTTMGKLLSQPSQQAALPHPKQPLGLPLHSDDTAKAKQKQDVEHQRQLLLQLREKARLEKKAVQEKRF